MVIKSLLSTILISSLLLPTYSHAAGFPIDVAVTQVKKASPAELSCTKEVDSVGIFYSEHHYICTVHLSNEIGPSEQYFEVGKLLRSLTSKDIVVFRLAGMGGDGDGLLYLVAAIKNTKANTIMEVDGNIASAHAILAFTGKNIKINGEYFILFHSISGRNQVASDCLRQYPNGGTDRGIPVIQKCEEDGNAVINIYNKVMDPIAYKILTTEEQVRYEQGHDIILSSDEIIARLGVH